MTDQEKFESKKDLILGSVSHKDGSLFSSAMSRRRKSNGSLPVEGTFKTQAAPFSHRKEICPHLGMDEDPELRFRFPSVGHRCYVVSQKAGIPREHQAAFCFSNNHIACSRYVKPSPQPVEFIPYSPSDEAGLPSSVSRAWMPILAGALAGVILLAIVGFLGRDWLQQIDGSNFAFLNPFGQATSVAAVLSDEDTATPILTSTPEAMTATPQVADVAENPASALSTAIAATLDASSAGIGSTNSDAGRVSSVNRQDATINTPTPLPDTLEFVIPASVSDVGWVSSADNEEDRLNHFGDSFLYSGVYQGDVYFGAFQFELTNIPRGAPIYRVSVQMTGLSDERKGEGGTWRLRLLGTDIDQGWRRGSYEDIFNATSLETIEPVVNGDDLAVGSTYSFDLSSQQIEIIEQRMLEQVDPKVSFRLDGPVDGPDNLFAWDTGYGSQSQGFKVLMTINVDQAPATPPPIPYIVLTSTPTPANMTTAVALVLAATADATRTGTATPLPENVVTATPFPEELILTPTPTAGNTATLEAIIEEATAQAFTTGTATPIPVEAITATPTVTPTPTPTFVIITSTPSPVSIFAAATQVMQATIDASTFGTATPFPKNWVTPIVVTSTPIPLNAATAQAVVIRATAEAFVFGAPTATPINVQTATPTPIFVLIDPLSSLSVAPTPTATPNDGPIPDALIGKIAFKSNRDGKTKVYVVNPDGTGLAVLSDLWPYDVAKRADALSPDGRFRVFVRDAIRYDGKGERDDAPALFWLDSHYNAEQQMTFFGAGMAYDPVWSPVTEQIAFVSNDSGNDEIWVMSRDGSEMRQVTYNEWEWDKHPSWSPDGSQIVFWSNRGGQNEIWVMNADGSGVYRLSTPGFVDWDPVWIKYPMVPHYRQSLAGQ